MTLQITQALIPAAGRGLRAYPKTKYLPKPLLEIDGKTLLQRNIEILRDELFIKDITVIVGYEGEQIISRFGSGESLGVALRYLKCDDPEIGLARGMLLAESLFQKPFITVLGDELYHRGNHHELVTVFDDSIQVLCAVLTTNDLHQIKKNYAVQMNDGYISALVEKPQKIENHWLGCGTFVFTPEIFTAIRNTPASPRSGRIELIDTINSLANTDNAVRPFHLTGQYFNINTVDDYNYAQYKIRAERFAQCKVSVVIPAYNEEASIGFVVEDFKDRVDEVLVVNNSSRDNTAQVAAAAGARVETAKLIGYGDTIRYGLDRAIGDILVVVEADHSFKSRDLNKLLEYLKDADMVIGTRTTRELVEQSTNMRGPVRWGNVLVAKGVEALWWGQQPRFTDVGCTYRALWRETYQSIRPLLKGVGPELSPEMMIAVLQVNKRIIEVPVSYHKRIGGESKHSANYFKISQTALRMLRTILRQRFQ
jgi:UDP-N-acetylglucosamine diphosphorylase / glucose-1-phosphate thymidylyltransferase / UDP-N-acetylgalactosamine diphosphorylase / glucosamine-1-phosphate N-acetyltransferase / galactosamine-1-phosphate N-acetyltransferase